MGEKQRAVLGLCCSLAKSARRHTAAGVDRVLNGGSERPDTVCRRLGGGGRLVKTQIDITGAGQKHCESKNPAGEYECCPYLDGWGLCDHLTCRVFRECEE